MSQNETDENLSLREELKTLRAERDSLAFDLAEVRKAQPDSWDSRQN